MELNKLFTKQQALRILDLKSPMMLAAGQKLVKQHNLTVYVVGGYSSAFHHEEILRIIPDVVDDKEAALERYREELKVSADRQGSIEDYVGRAEAVRLLGMSYQTVQNHAAGGKIRTVDFGGISYYCKEDIEGIKQENS